MTDTARDIDASLSALVDIMARLRDPERGCPWDLKQDFHTIVPHTLEEAYELADAVESGETAEIKDELGDVLFQVVFLAQIAAERHLFDINDVVEGICTKLVRRHPHVFSADGSEAIGPEISEVEVKENWEQIKSKERQGKQQSGFLDGVPIALPGLVRAQKLQKRAARAGFDWTDMAGVWAKLDEELAELREAIANRDVPAIESEMGDVLFAAVNLARHLDVDAETATRRTAARFEERFRLMEREALSEGMPLENESLDQLEKRWQRVKRSLASD